MFCEFKWADTYSNDNGIVSIDRNSFSKLSLDERVTKLNFLIAESMVGALRIATNK